MSIRTTSCAAYGAALGFMSVQDAAVIVHGSRSCQNMMFSFKSLRELEKRKYRDDLGLLESRRMVCTEMDEMGAIFGGSDLLQKTAQSLLDNGWKNVFATTTCVPGLVGDDCKSVARRLEKSNPGCCVGCVEASGNMTGDWEEGFNDSSKVLAGYMEESPEQDDSINIIAERYFYYFNQNIDDRIIRMLDDFEVRVNCRYLYRSTMDEIRGFKKARCNMPVIDDYISDTVLKQVSFGNSQSILLAPNGFDAYLDWADEMSKIYTPRDSLQNTLEAVSSAKERIIETTDRNCNGKTAIIYHEETDRIDWEVDALKDIGMKCVVVAKNSDRNAVLRRNQDVTVEDASKVTEFRALLKEYRPDIIISDTDLGTSKVKQHYDVKDRIVSESDTLDIRAPMMKQFYPGAGIEGVVRFLTRVNDILGGRGMGSWRNDI